MNRNDPYRRGRQNRYEDDDSRQSEQFSETMYDQDGRERGYGQMGDSGSRSNYGQFDSNRYGSHADWDDWGEDRDRGRQGRTRGDEDSANYLGRGGGYASGGYGPSRYTNAERRGFGSFNSNDFGGRDFSGPQRNYGAGRRPSDRYGSYGSGGYGAGVYGNGRYGRSEYDQAGSDGRRWERRDHDDDRGFFERAGDEVASWFGDEEAARRREQDHRGHGPANYKRSDERILEDACDRLTDDWGVDASNIQVTVQGGEVTLDGTVADRRQKRRAEDVVHDLSGVSHVQNNLRVQQRGSQGTGNRTDSTSGTLA